MSFTYMRSIVVEAKIGRLAIIDFWWLGENLDLNCVLYLLLAMVVIQALNNVERIQLQPWEHTGFGQI